MKREEERESVRWRERGKGSVRCLGSRLKGSTLKMLLIKVGLLIRSLYDVPQRHPVSHTLNLASSSQCRQGNEKKLINVKQEEKY